MADHCRNAVKLIIAPACIDHILALYTKAVTNCWMAHCEGSCAGESFPSPLSASSARIVDELVLDSGATRTALTTCSPVVMMTLARPWGNLCSITWKCRRGTRVTSSASVNVTAEERRGGKRLCVGVVVYYIDGRESTR